MFHRDELYLYVFCIPANLFSSHKHSIKTISIDQARSSVLVQLLGSLYAPCQGQEHSKAENFPITSVEVLVGINEEAEEHSQQVAKYNHQQNNDINSLFEMDGGGSEQSTVKVDKEQIEAKNPLVTTELLGLNHDEEKHSQVEKNYHSHWAEDHDSSFEVDGQSKCDAAETLRQQSLPLLLLLRCLVLMIESLMTLVMC